MRTMQQRFLYAAEIKPNLFSIQNNQHHPYLHKIHKPTIRIHNRRVKVTRQK